MLDEVRQEAHQHILRRLRISRRLTFRALADLTGISRGTLCNYEGGLKVSADSAFLLSEFYGIPFKLLYDWPRLPTQGFG